MNPCIIFFLVAIPNFSYMQGMVDQDANKFYLEEQLALLTKMEDVKYLLRRSSGMSLDIEDLTVIKSSLQARSIFDGSKDYIRIYFYSQANAKNAVIFNQTQVGSLIKMSHFSSKKKSVFIIHGWHSNYTSGVNTDVKAAILKSYDVNIFVVDWSQVAEENYLTATGHISTIGRLIGDFIKDLSKEYNYSLSDIQVVGHSLGAHVAGMAGKHTFGRLGYIMGLDPAGPLFSVTNADTRLAKTDAKFVEVIHTCGKLLGFYLPLGDADYYPNGGLSQPGCGVIEDIDGGCSHARAYQYYAESITNGGFTAKKCPFYFNYLLGKCKNSRKSEMGQYHPYKNVTGKYYLETNPSAPFAKE